LRDTEEAILEFAQPLARFCRLLEFRLRRLRTASARVQSAARLLERITEIHKRSRNDDPAEGETFATPVS
jgi:hypothetical protein